MNIYNFMDHDGDLISEVVLPLMNVDRRTANGKIDETEPSQSQIYITSAGYKGSFSYNKLIELFVQSIVSPKSTFVWGCDYRIPMMHGLLNQSFIEELKLSPTYKEDSFAREYLSIWSGSSSESWINYDTLNNFRKIVNFERQENKKGNKEIFYMISVDVARTGVLTSIQVFKVIPHDNYFEKKLVYITGLHDMHFSLQAIEIKKLYIKFQPKEIVIDGTGIGLGLMDFMVLDQIGNDGVFYPGLASFNDEDYIKYSGKKVIYVLKANSSLNSKIHGTCYSQLANGNIRLLIKEQDAKSKMLALKKSSKLKQLEKIQRMAPYIETSKLIEEMCNLKLKNIGSGNQDIVVERINSRINKDRFSAFEYGIWRIKELEDIYYKKKNQRKKRSFSNFIMVN